KIQCMLSVLKDHSTLVMALVQCDVPWSCHLLQTVLNNGASVCAIVCMIEDALEHGHHPRRHSKESMDLLLLIYRLGRGNLLFVLNQRLALPSLCTL
ncbi:hypothetical protein PAXRUDRAFT_157194, partial [Paxillus rubicundulus Ve08.2h10]